MEKPLLAIKNLTAWYSSEKAVLSNFSVELAGHESVGLIELYRICRGQFFFVFYVSGISGLCFYCI